MKTLFGILIATMITGTQAASAFQDQLTCYGNGNVPFHFIPTTPYLFVPVGEMNASQYDNSLFAPFAESNDNLSEIMDSSLALQIDPDICQVYSHPVGGRLAECHFDRANQTVALAESRVHFRQLTKSPSGAHEDVQVSRSLNLQSLDFSVDVVDGQGFQGKEKRAFARLRVTALVGSELRVLETKLNLGEWTDATNRSNYDRCVITPATDRTLNP